MDTIGLERRSFELTVNAQNQAYELLAELEVHVPDEIPWKVQSKFTIRDLLHDEIKSKDGTQIYQQQNHLYQCSCRTDNKAGQHPSNRHDIPWRDVGCCAWLRVITTFDLKVREYALSLFGELYTLNLMCTLCCEFLQKKFNHLSEDQIHYGNNSYQYILNEHEATSLYHTLNQQLGIPQCSAAHTNLDLWFCADNPKPPSPLLLEACLCYQLYIQNVSDRFIIIISTPQQWQLAWKHSHHQLMFLDGTFGFCSARMLLFTPMALNDLKRGVPLGHIIFSACESTKSSSVHANYNRPARDEIRKHLAHLLLHLLEEIDIYEDAIAAFNQEVQYYKTAQFDQNILMKSQAKGALPFLAYLQSYSKYRSFWLSWSVAGAQEAECRLNIPVDQVHRTTNSLESFQGHLKNNYFGSCLCSGCLLRLDLWLIILVLPKFFQTQNERHARANFYKSKRQALPNQGGRSSTPTSSEIHKEVAAHYSDAALLHILDEDHDNNDPEPLTEEETVAILPLVGTKLSSNEEEPASDSIIQTSQSDITFIDNAALDESVILADLMGTCPKMAKAKLSDKTISPLEAPKQDNQQVIAFQELLQAEDIVLSSLRQLLRLGMTLEDLDEYISPRIRDRLNEDSSALSEQVPTSDSDFDHSSHKRSPSPTVATAQLLPFEPQKKQRHHKSHGIW
ncbi:hypothetical protein WOLCODRAFT_20228 [Wolfiporia cocos MD-104 SS10]|uniref:Uncharacterized protein n=1 Tax=Wolfiporia cocos (strain MD-104) TaxID=742152 RepID=A0A2H3J827_WOLCO|nr:hypothetical protein WOLCODRAFT_20228 [Wolfiporia cocos MD-104 SS10]